MGRSYFPLHSYSLLFPTPVIYGLRPLTSKSSDIYLLSLKYNHELSIIVLSSLKNSQYTW